MRAYVHIYRVFVLEALRADGTVVQRTLLPLATAARAGRTAAGTAIGRGTVAAAAGTAAGGGTAAVADDHAEDSAAPAAAAVVVVVGHIGIVVVVVVVGTAVAALVLLFGLADASKSTTCP